MDWLKTKAPFWKMEEGPDGQGWVAAKAALEPLLPFLKTQSAAPKAGAPTAAPLLSSKPQPATMPAAATNGEYWERFDQSRPNDAARLAAALAHAAS